jgi:hypothetical protein
MMYKIIKTGIDDIILRELDNANIPMDAANNDYQEYLKWVVEGNVAEEVDN